MKTSERSSVHLAKEKSISARNFHYIMETRQLNQEKFAEELGISEQFLVKLLKGDEIPDIDLLMHMKSLYGISIDEFLTFEIEYYRCAKNYNDTADASEIRMLRRFCGIYYMHYFDTTFYKYPNISDKLKPHLTYGLLHIYEEKTLLGNSYFRVSAITAFSRKECTKYFSEFSANPDIKKLSDLDIPNDKRNQFYEGEIVVTPRNMFISLSSEFKDKCLMIFQNFDSSEEYLGGMGTVNSVSRGHESMPCAQFMMITRKTLTCDENEIAEFLHLGYQKMTLSDDQNLLVTRLKKIIECSGGNMMNGISLSDDETDIIIRHNVERLVNSLIKHQRFRCAMVSLHDDYEWSNVIGKFIKESSDE